MNKLSFRFALVAASAAVTLSACSSQPSTSEESTQDLVEIAETESAETESAETGEDSLPDNESSVENLPVLEVFEDEDGPADLTGMYQAAEIIFEAKLVEVRPELRYYGPDSEAPDAVAFEQIELIFEPTEIYKGSIQGETIAVAWTGYRTEGTNPGSKRIAQVTIYGIRINERAIGQRYGIFISDASGEVIHPLTSEGIVPLNPAGIITGRDGHGGVLVHDLVGKPFSDAVQAE